MRQTTLTVSPNAEGDAVWGFTAPPLKLTGDHRITITADGDDDDVNGHLVWLVAIGVAAAVSACGVPDPKAAEVLQGPYLPNRPNGGSTQGSGSGSGSGGPRPQ